MKSRSIAFRKKLALQFVAIVAIYLAVTTCFDLFAGKSLTDRVGAYSLTDESIKTGDDLSYTLISDGGEIDVQKLFIKDREVHYKVKGIKPGKVFLSVKKKGADTDLFAEYFNVSRFGRVTNISNGNYSNYRFHLLMNVIVLTLFSLLLLWDLIRFRKKLLYSYDQMFVGGLLIWLFSTVIIQWYTYFSFDYVFDYYTKIQQSAFEFMFYTIPVVWPFCIALTISNISLIKHEGYRTRNALGIIISAMLMAGSLVGVLLSSISFSGSTAMKHVVSILLSSYCSLYSLFACLLEGAVIGGIIAAKHTPKMDTDYIIILGCMIRKDGSLTPLLRGRVDRAILHGKKQEERTGKKVIFVPSGGQGKNEVMPEAHAMRNYLLSEGIEEERILVEDQSKNTMENMKFSKKLIEEQKKDARVAFSTTNFHVFRSGIIATQQDFFPEGMGSRTKWYFWPNAFIREFIGMLVYTKFTVVGIFLALTIGFAVIEMLM